MCLISYHYSQKCSIIHCHVSVFNPLDIQIHTSATLVIKMPSFHPTKYNCYTQYPGSSKLCAPSEITHTGSRAHIHKECARAYKLRLHAYVTARRWRGGVYHYQCLSMFQQLCDTFSTGIKRWLFVITHVLPYLEIT